MAYRDFSKRHPVLGGWVIPALGGIVVFGALLPFIPWGLAALAGFVAGALIEHRTY